MVEGLRFRCGLHAKLLGKRAFTLRKNSESFRSFVVSQQHPHQCAINRFSEAVTPEKLAGKQDGRCQILRTGFVIGEPLNHRGGEVFESLAFRQQPLRIFGTGRLVAVEQGPGIEFGAPARAETSAAVRSKSTTSTCRPSGCRLTCVASCHKYGVGILAKGPTQGGQGLSQAAARLFLGPVGPEKACQLVPRNRAARLKAEEAEHQPVLAIGQIDGNA